MASKRTTGSSGSKEQKQKDKKKKAAKDISVIEENFMQEDEGIDWKDVSGESEDDSSSDDMEGDAMEEGLEGGESSKKKKKAKKKTETKDKVYLPGEEMGSGDELVFEPSSYKMYHSLNAGASCLSFDILKDSLGDNRTNYPLSMYLVAGSQSNLASTNSVVLMKLNKLVALRQSGEDKASDSDSEDELYDEMEDTPDMKSILIKHTGGVNRIRCAPLLPDKRLVATWSDTGTVHIWDITKHSITIDAPAGVKQSHKPINEPPLFSFSGHQVEGFAMDWSPLVVGQLATGDCRKNIHLWNPKQDGSWHVDQRPFTGHTASVEDIQWSPNEETVFASCSVDKSIRIWDIRAVPSKACMITSVAHDSDVNVISWNRLEPFIVSGGDDGVLKIWDLRMFKDGTTSAVFKHHTAPVTSVEWHPSDSTVLASAGEDNQVVQWDLAVEKDTPDKELGANESDEPDVAPQLLFIHQGQTEVKEVHWHPQIPGVLISTAANGIDIFRTISV